MALKITRRSLEETPRPTSSGRVNEDLEQLKQQMRELAPGSALEFELQRPGDARRVKALVTRATRELGANWRHWSMGNKVFAAPWERQRRHGRPRRSAALQQIHESRQQLRRKYGEFDVDELLRQAREWEEEAS